MAIQHAPSPVATVLQERWTKLRSHKRIISKVKLLVEWDEDSAPRGANAVTVDVSYSGCMAVVGADLRRCAWAVAARWRSRSRSDARARQ